VHTKEPEAGSSSAVEHTKEPEAGSEPPLLLTQADHTLASIDVYLENAAYSPELVFIHTDSLLDDINMPHFVETCSKEHAHSPD
jgi:hypothetical protein